MRTGFFRQTLAVAMAAAAAGVVAVAAGPAHAQPSPLLNGFGLADWRVARCQLLPPAEAACGHDSAGVEVGWAPGVPSVEQGLGAVPAVCPRRGRE